MAKYEVTFSCGHTEVVNLTGKHSYRDYKLQQYREVEVCSECRRELRKKMYETKYQKALQEAEENGLCTLIGDEASIKSAIISRNNYLQKDRDELVKNLIDPYYIKDDELEKQIHHNLSESKQELHKIIEDILATETNPIVYLEQKHFFKEVYKRLDLYLNYETRMLEEKTKKEALVSVENSKNLLPIEITVSDKDIVSVKSEKDDEVISICKRLGYRWNPDKRTWYKMVRFSVNSEEGVVDSIAEIGNELLNNGFCVRIYDKEAREKAISGNFIVPHKLWIGIDDDGFCYIFPRDNEMYNKIRSISRTSWDHYEGYLKTAVIRYKEVIDFASANDFWFTKKASNWIESQKKDISETIVSVEKKIAEKKLKNKNIRDEEVEVLEDLLD